MSGERRLMDVTWISERLNPGTGSGAAKGRPGNVVQMCLQTGAEVPGARGLVRMAPALPGRLFPSYRQSSKGKYHH